MTTTTRRDLREISCEAALRDFREAYEGLVLTPAQERVLDWAAKWDQPTLNALADVIRTARRERKIK